MPADGSAVSLESESPFPLVPAQAVTQSLLFLF
jgi:hypothetical protein